MVIIEDNSHETDYVKTADISLDGLFELNSKVFFGVKYYRQTESFDIEKLFKHIEDFGLDPKKCLISIAKDEVSKRNPTGKRYVLYSTEHESVKDFVDKMVLTED